MPANKRKNSLLFFLWPATLLAAFFFGRLSTSNNPAAVYQSTLESAEPESQAKQAQIKKLRPDREEEELVVINGEDLDPLLLIRSAIAEGDPLKRMSKLTDAFSKLTKDNIMDGIRLLESMPDGNLKRQMEQLILNTWGKLDGPAAMEYVLSQEQDEGIGRGRGRGGRGGPDFGGGLRDTMSVMSGWAETDPRAAVAYASENGTGDRGRNTMLMAALQGWANTDIRGAVDYAMTQVSQQATDNPGRGGRGGGMENFLINRYVSEDPQAASQWALSQSDPNARIDAVGTVARSMAGDSPEQAAQWAQALSDPEAQSEAIKGTASGWARQDPTAAMDWALSIEDSTTANQAAKSALSTWAREDPYSASDYVIGMEAGAEKDQAAATLTSNLVRQDPEMALLWAESITDPNLQMKTLSPIANGWMNKNPAQATEWINASSLPDETKQALLTPRKP